MGWANCGEDSKGRPIGYAHAATCDHPGCEARIDRGLSYACGGMHGTAPAEGSFDVCEGYFCTTHLSHVEAPGEGAGGCLVAVCAQCRLDLLEAKVEEYADVLKALANGEAHDFDDWDRMAEPPSETGSEDRRLRMIFDLLSNWGDTGGLTPKARYMTRADFDAVTANRARDAEFRTFLAEHREDRAVI
mgnify:CR=1 FL=1